jgi:hypothetical protein
VGYLWAGGGCGMHGKDRTSLRREREEKRRHGKKRKKMK